MSKKFFAFVFMIFVALAFVFPVQAQERVVTVGGGSPTKLVSEFITYTNMNTGNVYYVDSGSGLSASGIGDTWSTAFLTLDEAFASCTANNGDVVFVAPGHNEGITTAGEIDIDVVGVTVVGLGTGSLKPTIDFDAAAASVAIGADNVTVKNIRFRTSYNAVVVGLDIEDGADYAKVIDCEFGWAETGTDEFAISIRTNDASNYALIEGCYFDAGAQAAVTGISFVKDTKGTVVRDNIFMGSFSTAAINGTTTLSTNLVIEENIFYQGATEPAIELLTGTTGMIRLNYIKTNLATVAASIVADAAFCFNNYYNEDAGGDAAAIEFGAAASVTATADD